MQHSTNDEPMKDLTPMDDISRIETSDSATTRLAGPNSRRNFLKGAMATGLAAGGLGLLGKAAHAQTAGTSPDTATQIFSIAATAERLAVTFYTNAMNSASALGFTPEELTIIQAALIEEQIHELFFEKNGGVPLTSTFSFPAGAATFTDLNTFISTQQLLEGAFDSAFIAAAFEFSEMGMHDVARIAVQIAMVEEEHRELGNYIATAHGLTTPSVAAADATTAGTIATVLKAVDTTFSPADNWVFAPQLVPSVGAAPAVLTAAGFLSPVAGNTYSYAQVDFSATSSVSGLAAVAANVMYQSGPFVAAASTPTSAHLADPSGGIRGRAGAEFES
jgi:catechol 2,3-dioxygenase-like lactoylglutathione lyase family enzyme